MVNITLRLEQVSGQWLGWIDEYPGAYSQGPTVQAAIHDTQHAIFDFLQWLKRHGEFVPDGIHALTASLIQVNVAETIPAKFLPGGDVINALIASDTVPASDQEIAYAVRLLDYARTDLMNAAFTFPPDTWDQSYGRKSIRAILTHLWHKERTMIGLLPSDKSAFEVQHGLLETERQIYSRLGITAEVIDSNHPILRIYQLQALRHMFREAILMLPATMRDNLFLLNAEPWTLRKMLRRALFSEQYFTAQMTTPSEPNAHRNLMTIDEYLDSLPYVYFEREYNLFWVKVIISMADLIGPDTDQDLQTLTDRLLRYHERDNALHGDVVQIRMQIIRIQGTRFSLDNSVLGRKYRVLNAICSTIEDNDKNQTDWMYGISTALNLIKSSGISDEQIIQQIKYALSVFNKDIHG